jgi:hypothetical protein
MAGSGRDLRLKYNEGVKISHHACCGIRNDNRATLFRKMLYFLKGEATTT